MLNRQIYNARPIRTINLTNMQVGSNEGHTSRLPNRPSFHANRIKAKANRVWLLFRRTTNRIHRIILRTSFRPSRQAICPRRRRTKINAERRLLRSITLLCKGRTRNLPRKGQRL